MIKNYDYDDDFFCSGGVPDLSVVQISPGEALSGAHRLPSLFVMLRPIHQGFKKPLNMFFGAFIDQIPLSVKALSGVSDHHLGLVDGMHVEKHKHLSQVVLRAGCSNVPNGCAHYRYRFAVPGIVSVGP